MTPPQSSRVFHVPSRKYSAVLKNVPPKLRNETSWSALPEMPGAPTTCNSAALLTDEFNTARPMTLRKFSGSSETCLEEMSEAIFAFSEFRRGACELTSTVSVTAPMTRLTFRVAVWPAASVMPSCLACLKPVASTSSKYVAGGRSVNEKKPFSSVVKVRVMARSALKIVTRAWPTLWPDESKTVPLIEAVIWDCPSADCPQARKITIADHNRRRFRNLLARAMHTPLPDISAERPRLHPH